jgi:hypothetical protein
MNLGGGVLRRSRKKRKDKRNPKKKGGIFVSGFYTPIFLQAKAIF